MQHLTMNLENIILEYIITDRCIALQKVSHIQVKLEKAGQEVM